jgi:hypothetical protein
LIANSNSQEQPEHSEFEVRWDLICGKIMSHGENYTHKFQLDYDHGFIVYNADVNIPQGNVNANNITEIENRVHKAGDNCVSEILNDGEKIALYSSSELNENFIASELQVFPNRISGNVLNNGEDKGFIFDTQGLHVDQLYLTNPIKYGTEPFFSGKYRGFVSLPGTTSDINYLGNTVGDMWFVINQGYLIVRMTTGWFIIGTKGAQFTYP